MKDIKDLEDAINEVMQSNLTEKTQKILLALLGKEIMEIRSDNQRIFDNLEFYKSK